MHTRRNKLGHLAGTLVLAVGLAGVGSARAAQAPADAGNATNLPAKQATLHKQEKKKAKAKAQSKTQPAAAKEISQLKQQVATQQKQIEELLHAVSQLQAQTAASQKTAHTVSAVRPAPQYPSDGQVASLSPILPATPEAAQGGSASKVSPVILPTASSAPRAVPAGKSEDKKLGPLAFEKIKLGVTFFGDYGLYTNTGFGPQFLTQINQPGPGNGDFNSFDVTRAYLNFFYTPIDAVTLRITPNIYRQIATGVGGQANGNGASFGASANGNLAFRLKYAYIDFNHPFKHSKAFGKDKITIGQTTNPWIDWEEGLYSYRYVNLVPWNYISLSSTYGGIKIHGPIMINGKEYLDYDLGAFNTQSFHSLELTDKKQVMGRLTWYPMGTTKDRTGFAITVFEDYGSNGKLPDTHSTPDYRFATVGSYQTHDKGYLIAGEFDLGRNVFSTGNLFSGVGPVAGGPYDSLNTLSAAILAGDRTKQRGYAVFGHARLGGSSSPWALFGMYQFWQPNTNVSNDPLDFERIVGGISYRFNKHLDFAVDSQNLIYTKSQFTFPAGVLSGVTTAIPNAVPDSTNAIFFNMQFNY